ncbi:FGGY-family carbohydrate kinase [Primorskyibacter sp. 2E107]|uniref:FGGY-family carbohydrate kinase n=1 Tax=Primorskyibacter sp. 2E107 TaxID=3403458 RepID=UPI003AF476C0
MTSHVCAVDVGTLSARAAIFSSEGTMLSREVVGFAVHEPDRAHAEYASDQIWQAVCAATRAAIATSGVDPGTIAALGFDATCSLVLLDTAHTPLSLGEGGRDTIAWFDHRAVHEADLCTATGADLIRHLGATMSPEMQSPKLLWLKRQRPDLWARLGWAGDLADYLVLKATGISARSICTSAAKWPFLPDAGGWQTDFLAQIDLADLPQKAGLSDSLLPVGTAAGKLTPQAAQALGLTPRTTVGGGIIDAFAGALGTQGLFRQTPDTPQQTLITGTSNCIMSIGTEPLYRSGIWGPYLGAVLPGKWVSEGGQSAAGALLDYMLDTWPRAASEPRPTHAQILRRLEALIAQNGPTFANHIHVLPDFNGNRAPLSDPLAKGVVSGLTLDRSFDGLCGLYWRSALSLALGVRQIIEHIGGQSGTPADLAVVGGLTQSDLLTQLFADVTGRRILSQRRQDTVLLGTATMAFASVQDAPDLTSIARAMAQEPSIFTPDPAAQAAYALDYRAFLRMQDHRAELTALNRPQ